MVKLSFFLQKAQKNRHLHQPVVLGVIFFMLISKVEVLKYKWRQYKWPVFLAITCFVSIYAFIYFSIGVGVTGEITEHQATVIGNSISHGYGPMSQSIQAKLGNGKNVLVNNDGKVVKNGDLVIIIERHRSGKSESIYEFKNKI